MSEPAKQGAQVAEGLRSGLGLIDATTIVVGVMIGSGIFLVSADIARQVQSPALLIATWIVTGIMTCLAALSYAELAAAMPHAGGQYVFLREAFGPLWAFLYGWSMLAVVQTGSIAAVGIAFAKFTGVIFGEISSTAWLWHIGTFGPYDIGVGELGPYDVGLNTQNLLAIVSILFLTWLNTRGLRLGAMVQNVFTVTKTGALLLLVLLGFVFATEAATQMNFHDFFRNAGLFTPHPYAVGSETVMIGTVTLVGVAMVGSLFAADAWNNVTFTAAEVNNPTRNVPLALVIGTGLVTAIYVLANFSYLSVLPLEGNATAMDVLGRGMQYPAEDRVGTAVAEVIFGQAGAVLIAVAVMISTFGCNNGMILAGARLYYAMAKDRLLFERIGTVNARHLPATALWVQGAWASVLCLSGTYSQLLDFLIFTVVLFYIITIIGLFVLRIKRPDLPRPYKVHGYPVLPALYVLLATFIEVQLLRYKPQYTYPGLVLVALGAPIYFYWRWRAQKTAGR
jgi:APA family basic amino acid/polyamine antiporter